jgi:thiosulfate/3-mercaptopyruvate sulfurtransferase
MIAPFVDAAWLRAHREEVVVADCRLYLDGRSAEDAYAAGHIVGAVFVDLERGLAAPASPAEGRHPLPSAEAFAEGMARAGIGDATTVVAYDDAGGVMAARLVWMLRATGHHAALLDGGLRAWDEPLSRSAPTVEPATFLPVPWPAERLASIGDAASRAGVVLDARQPERYRGDTEPIDPRAGHIPGARNVPAREHLDPSSDRLLPVERLRERLEAAGAGPDTISSCGSGVTACHTLLVMEHAGLGPGRLYPGSWSQWSHDDSRPVATGDEPG